MDLDLIETLFQLCPELFAEFDDVDEEMDSVEQAEAESTTNRQDSSNSNSCNSNNSFLSDNARNLQSPSTSSTTTENPSSVGPESMDSSGSPPHVIVDDSPLQKSMDRNKECKHYVPIFPY